MKTSLCVTDNDIRCFLMTLCLDVEDSERRAEEEAGEDEEEESAERPEQSVSGGQDDLWEPDQQKSNTRFKHDMISALDVFLWG